MPVFAVLVLAGCTDGRDTDPPEQALLGHWQAEDNYGAFVIARERWFSAEGGFASLDDDGELRKGTYEVVSQNRGSRTITVLHDLPGDGDPWTWTYAFTEDFASAGYYIGKYENSMHYMDSRQQP